MILAFGVLLVSCAVTFIGMVWMDARMDAKDDAVIDEIERQLAVTRKLGPAVAEAAEASAIVEAEAAD